MCQLVNVWPARKSPLSPATQTLVGRQRRSRAGIRAPRFKPGSNLCRDLLTCNPRTADPDMRVAAFGAPVIVAVSIVCRAAPDAAARTCLQLILDQESD